MIFNTYDLLTVQSWVLQKDHIWPQRILALALHYQLFSREIQHWILLEAWQHLQQIGF